MIKESAVYYHTGFGESKSTPEPAGERNMLDNTLLLFGSASSAFHLSRNYSLILAGGKPMGFKHAHYLDFAGEGAYRGAWRKGDPEPWKKKAAQEDLPLQTSSSPCFSDCA